MGMVAREDVQVFELAAIIERDPLLTGQVLRSVNSAAFALRREVTSVAYACALMGTNRLRNVAVALSMATHWKQFRVPKFWSQKRFNRHSLAVALLADKICLQMQAEDGEACFLAGLLHDIGKILMASAHPQAFQAISMLPEEDRQAVERETFGIDHAELSAMALARWKVSTSVLETVRFHHSPNSVPGTWVQKGWLHAAHVLLAVDRFVNDSGVTLLQGHPVEPLPEIPNLPAPAADLKKAVAELWSELNGMEAPK